MPNNTRQKIKKAVDSALNDHTRALANYEKIMSYYAPENMEFSEIIDTIYRVLNLAQETGNDNAMMIYRTLVRENHIQSLGEYEQHLFNIGSIYVAERSILEACTSFKRWEAGG